MRPLPFLPIPSLVVLFLSSLSFQTTTAAATTAAASSGPQPTQWITYTNQDGETLYLDNNREPALYTQDYGDCQGNSLIHVNRFDAAYYKDNMTILFHLGATSQLRSEAVMMYIGVYAYGENRFNLTFDPCFANIRSMCPVNSSVPIEANGVIPVAPSDVANIPELALSIPDFEGQAILRIFSNSTQSQIACYSAVLTNGHTFSHPTAVGTTVGVFVFAALIASMAVAIYGQNLQETRKHYAHSLSIFVVFAVLQHVFFTGALSMNWPSVLVGFWSNFGWASGMIYTHDMQRSISQFVGNNRGNIKQFGTAAAGQNAVNLGGGYSLTSIYKRYLGGDFRQHEVYGTLQTRNIEHVLSKRAIINSTSGFKWYGGLVDSGLPLPGNYSGFSGTLGQLHIPASNAFLTGLLWFLILVVLMAAFTIFLKVIIELLVKIRMVKTRRLDFFRNAWIYCVGVVILRTCYIAFFMMMFLTLFQFTLGGASGPLAIAAIVFVLFLIGMLGLCAYALYYRLSGQKFHQKPDKLELRRTKGSLSWTRQSAAVEGETQSRAVLTIPWRRTHFEDLAQRPHVHDDDDYLIKFGWLSARFRRSQWWFFSAWIIYEFVRACFYGGAAGHPLTQVFGLLAWEIISLIAIVITKPFESNRLNVLMVYLLGFSKVVCVALSSAFDPRFGLSRILTTVIGIIIIVIQGVLVICLLIFIVIGCVSSWMSIRRYKEDFRPTSLVARRQKYFEHMNFKETDKPRPKVITVEKPEADEKPKDPYFAITSVRRETKIEDDDVDNEDDILESELAQEAIMSGEAVDRSSNRNSRAQSLRSRHSASNLPYGARRHRASWSTRDFSAADFDPSQIPSGTQSRMSVEDPRASEALDTPIRAAGTPTGVRSMTPTRDINRGRAASRGSWAGRPSLENVAHAAITDTPKRTRSSNAYSKVTSKNAVQEQ